MKYVRNLPENIPCSGTLVFLNREKKDREFQLLEEIIVNSSLTEKERSLMLELLDWHVQYLSERGKEISIFNFVKECLLRPLDAKPFAGTTNTFLIPGSKRRFMVSLVFAPNSNKRELIDGEEFYQITWKLLSDLGDRELLEVTLIELPDYNLMGKFSVEDFIREIRSITTADEIDLEKINLLSWEMSLLSESLQKRLAALEAAKQELLNWLQSQFETEFNLD